MTQSNAAIAMSAAEENHETQDAETKGFRSEKWIECLRHLALHYRMAHSLETVRLTAAVDLAKSEEERIRHIARSLGLRVRFANPKGTELNHWQLPAAVWLASGDVVVVTAVSKDGIANVMVAGDEGLAQPIPIAELLKQAERVVLARPARSAPDARVDTYIKPHREDWLRRIILKDWRSYGAVLVASMIANSLGLAGIIFSMQIYDRVIPAESFNTLYVLFSGVVLCIVFDFVMRRTRMGITDIVGKRADLEMSDAVFGHALRVRNDARPSSTGSYISQLRDLEQVREMLTSTAVATFSDMPFFVLFLGIFWMIAGDLVFIPLVALVLLVTPGLLLQRKLRAHANEAMREASLRNAMLVETVQGLEDIKMMQAEQRFQQQWNHYTAVTGAAQIRLRGLTNSLGVWTQNVQTGVYALTVFAGAPMVINGDITTGSLVGASILGSRMLAPMSQLSQLLGRLQQAKIAKNGLDQIMRMPVDQPEDEQRIEVARVAGRYVMRNAGFRYAPGLSPALQVSDLKIESGERIAVLGKNGAGKSTLLQAMSGLIAPYEGEMLLDDLALQHIDPADVRRDVGLLTQNSRLFHGSLRDNVTMGSPAASAEQIQTVLEMVGADSFIRKLPKGLEYAIQEGGIGLSGGQKQAILLARLILRDPAVVLLDEPTAAMDDTTERHFIERFAEWSAGKTVVIATHRMRALDLVSRIIVVEGGKIALDDNREAALATLTGAGRVRIHKASQGTR
jgi:ATP-binding cassette subfamily C protein LapB